jgi:hypothetical protein
MFKISGYFQVFLLGLLILTLGLSHTETKSLETSVRQIGGSPKFMHNTGNDAYHTLILFLALLGKEDFLTQEEITAL